MACYSPTGSRDLSALGAPSSGLRPFKTVPEISSIWNQVHYLTYDDISEYCQ